MEGKAWVGESKRRAGRGEKGKRMRSEVKRSEVKGWRAERRDQMEREGRRELRVHTDSPAGLAPGTYFIHYTHPHNSMNMTGSKQINAKKIEKKNYQKKR